MVANRGCRIVPQARKLGSQGKDLSALLLAKLIRLQPTLAFAFLLDLGQFLEFRVPLRFKSVGD